MLVGLWLVWFVPIVREWRVVAHVAAAGGLAAAVVLPILLRYQAVHDSRGFSRGLEESTSFSADLTSLLSASSQLGVWGFLDRFARPEGQLFPGLTVVCLLAVGAIRSRWRPDGWQPPWLRGARAALMAIAGAFAAVVLSRLLFGPWDMELLGAHVSVHGFDKPFSFAMLFATAFVVSSPVVVAARARRSPFGFYLLALAAMWILSWGPFPTFLDQPVIHSGPYAWLRALSGFDGLRVPAWFWMLALVCLSAAGSLALARMTSAPSRTRHAIVGLVACGALADGWIDDMRTVPVPGRSTILEGLGSGPVLELPLGRHTDDLESMYRSIYHGRPVINGYSGYPAKHYAALRYGLADPQEDLVSLLAPLEVSDVLIDRKEADSPSVEHLARETGARRVAANADEILYRLKGAAPVDAHPTAGVSLTIAGLTASVNQDEVDLALDGDRMSRWHTGPQRPGHELTLDLGAPQAVSAVVLELGPFVADFPRLLTVELSLDHEKWTEVWRGPTAGKALRASFRDPLRVPLEFSADGRPTRFVRLRQLATDRMDPWSIVEIRVTGAESSSTHSD